MLPVETEGVGVDVNRLDASGQRAADVEVHRVADEDRPISSRGRS
jgi:hypothetical protein